jgi:3-deoxy-D-manno-octulosonic-acid transferase
LKTKGIYLLYRFLQALALPVVVIYFLFRSVRNVAYFPSLWQRLGFLSSSFKETIPGAIWLHAVSVGEVLSVIELARRLRAEFPRAPLFVSATTLAGRATARTKLAGLATGVFYAPIDHVFAVRRVLRTIQPALVIVVETEIWPNLFREAKRAGCGLILLNGRISDRTERRYRRQRWFFRGVMRWPDAVLAQSEAMRERYLAAGTPLARVRVGGNLKYDAIPQPAGPESPVRQFIESLSPAEVWVAASTMPPASAGDVDEDDAVIAAFHQLSQQHTGSCSETHQGRGPIRPAIRFAVSFAIAGCASAELNGGTERPVFAGGRSFYGRDAGNARRAQYSRAGKLRAARGLRPAHGEFSGNRR